MGRKKRQKESKEFWKSKKLNPLYIESYNAKDFIPLDSIPAFRSLDLETRQEIGINISRKAQEQGINHSYIVVKKYGKFAIKSYPKEWLINQL